MTHLLQRLALAGAMTALAVPTVAQTSSALVTKIEKVRDDVGRAKFSAQGDTIAFDRPAERGLYQIYTMRTDGSFERCLTCAHYDLRKTNAFNPAWHPSGDLVVFQVQKQARRLDLGPIEMATANRGLFSDLWIADVGGKRIWQLTQVVPNGGAIIDPHFSYEGSQLLWSERVVSRVGRWGTWVLRVATLKGDKIPRLAKPQVFQPGRQKLFLTGSAFTPDDRGVFIAGNREEGQRENGMDIYRVDLATKRAERLTHSRNAWDEKARVTAKGDRILWVSAGEITLRDAGAEPKLPLEQLRELWVMDLDGGDKQRLTYFNHPGANESLRAAIVNDFSQSPDGSEVLMHVIWPWRDRPRESLFRLELDESFHRR
ncbi:MAG: hypothetical protein VYE73_07165 [Acidobacteriota bacterium]|nr:hypothetical protein [Acidobacteriota bacterium]